MLPSGCPQISLFFRGFHRVRFSGLKPEKFQLSGQFNAQSGLEAVFCPESWTGGFGLNPDFNL
jgi:hypothetical protein